MKIPVFVAVLISAVIAATGASAGEDDDEGPDPRIGEEVRQICFARSIDGWRHPKGLGKAVLLEKGVNDWFLVEVSGPCRSSDFRFAESIGIDTRPAGGCLSRGDRILVRGAGNFVNRCIVTRIYEWDDDAVEDDEETEEETENTES